MQAKPIFAKRHYVAIAEALHSVSENPSKSEVIGTLIKMFHKDNPLFDAEKFINYVVALRDNI